MMATWQLLVLGLSSVCLLGKVFAWKQDDYHLHHTAMNENPSYDRNYEIKYGQDHIVAIDQGRQLQLSLDQSTGAGFQSKLYYGSGLFTMRIKLHNKDTAGVVTTFYLTSNEGDEMDFEFLGNREGKPTILQTNIYVDGEGLREQRMHLWFDPAERFHTYKILCNSNQIVFFVDQIPVRVLKRNTEAGVAYPIRPMQVVATIWNGAWATDGGSTQIDWTCAPFKAYYRGFNINGCPASSHNSSNRAGCHSTRFWWNKESYLRLNPQQERAHRYARTKYIFYDYCNDRNKHPMPPPECLQ